MFRILGSWSGQSNCGGKTRRPKEGLVIAEYSESLSSPTTPQWSKSYIYLGNRLLATLEPNGSGGEYIQYHHPDRLGTRLVANAQDTTYYEQQTLPFGTALNESPPTGGTTSATNRRFTTYDRSLNTGLDYAVNRHYDSQQGRFTQVDPIGMSAASLASPQSLNMYSYCGNDPINHVDPSGLFWGKLFGFVNKVIKWLKVALAVAIIVLTVWLAPALAGVVIAKMLIMAGLLLGSALGPRWLQTAITVGLAAVGIYLQGPQAIWNFAQAGAGGGDRALSAISWLNVVGTVTRYLGGPQKPTDDQTKKAVGDCTRELFAVTMNDFQPSRPGRNGSFDGRAIDRPAESSQVSVVNEVRAFNVSQLTSLYARFVGPSRGVRGLTIGFTDNNGQDTGFSPYRNFTARDSGRFPSVISGVSTFTATQIWELGNSLRRITNVAMPGGREAGSVMVDCVKEKL